MALQNITQPEYHLQPSELNNGLQGMYSMVHSFLGIVQPSGFPADFLARLINRQTDTMNPEAYKEVLNYQKGFLVCAVIGLLFIILVPLVGLCFCCCRCCGRCGGLMYQKQKKTTNCKRRAFFASLLAVTTILLAGNICAFISNNSMSTSVSGSFSVLNNTVENLNIYLSSIPKEIDVIIGASAVPLNHTNMSLMDIEHTLGDKIVVHLRGRVYATLDKAENLLKEINNVAGELQKVNESVSHLSELQEDLAQNLTSVREDLNKTLQDCGRPCQGVSVSNLKPGTNFSMILNIDELLQKIDELTRSNLSATIVMAKKNLTDIPKKVSEQTEKVVSETQRHLEDVKREIDDIRSKFSKLDSLNNISQSMNDVIKTASTYEPEVVTYDEYRWIVCIFLCCLVLAVIICNTLGLLFGACGLNSRVMPTKRSCFSNMGGNFLMASVGFSFLFAWLLMLAVLVTFLIGGNAYTLVCRPWANGQLLNFLETPGLFAEFNLTQILGLNSSNVTLTSVYSNCEKNAPLWNTLHLDDTISLDETLNISKYIEDIDSTLEKINISVNSMDILNDEQKNLLENLGTQDGPLSLDFNSILNQINQDVISGDLSALAKELDDLANQTGTNPSVRKKLEQHATELRKIQDWVNSSFRPEIQTLNSSIQNLQKSLPDIQKLVNSTLSEAEETESFLKLQTEVVIKNETKDFVNSLLGYFESYVDWAKSTVKDQVGRCGPIVWAMDSVNIVVCSNVVNLLNSFWFSLGWCTIFLLPSLILAVRLAKFYRRMHMDDIYMDETMESLELSRPPSTFRMPRAELRK
uniref:Prominin-1-A-like n=1 Tax=Salvator merianae TaxID=96440 RepID=A0A8D0E993_SALMN